jgi:hypothetical protein
MKYRKSKAVLVVLLALTIAGCAAKRPIHPGAGNQFDSNAYDALLVTDSIITSTRTDLNNNVFPPSIAPKVKDAINYVITAYNAANTSYRIYHAAVANGTVTPAQQAAVSDGLNQISGATTALVNAKAGK